jgi:hypothetical protein
MKIPDNLKEVFSEYLLIRLLDEMSDSDFQRFNKILQSKNNDSDIKVNQILEVVPNLKDKIDIFSVDFLNKIYGK